MVKKFENQGMAIIAESTKHADKARYDVKVVTRYETMPAFSLTEKELNTVIKGLEVLDNRRFGTIKTKQK